MARIVLLTLMVTFVCVREAQSTAQVRGAHPDMVDRYKPGQDFTCFDGSGTFEFSLVNDDYCDCQDGSDEPGTAACANGVFYCVNKGHVPENLLASRVNDGICDCCDGSDEYDSGVTCTNVCEEVGRAARKEMVKQMHLQAEGYKKRLEYERQGAVEKKEQEEKLVRLEAELETLKPELEALRLAKEVAEEPERKAKEEHKRRWEEELEKRRAEQRRVEAQAGFDELDMDSDGFVSVSELQARVELDNDEDGEVSATEALEYLDNEEKMDFEAFFERAWDVISDKCQFQHPEVEGPEDKGQVEEEDNEGDEDYDYDDEDEEEEDTTPPVGKDEMPDYDEATKELIDAANKAREAHSSMETKKRNLENDIRDTKKYLDVSFGPLNQFAPLYDKCYEYTDREYTYKMCVFSKVTQRGKHGGRDTSLGTWGSWEGGGDDPYSVMKYSNGEKCWNGPNRSATVKLQCGTEDEVIDASEPNRCEYALVFNTPTACEAPPPGHIHHEEL